MEHEPSILDAAVEALPEADQDRLARILDDYLVDVARGTPITPEELLERHPEDAEYLRGYLSGLQLFHAAALANDKGNAAAMPTHVGQRLGQVIGDYRLIHEIGRGGMGVVYEAEQVSLRRRVALKILPFTSMHDTKHIGRFKNEAQAAAQVHHPNIVPVFAIGEDDGVHYYAMQLISGHSLATVLDARRGHSSDGGGTTAPNNTATALTRSEATLSGKTLPQDRGIVRSKQQDSRAELSAGNTLSYVQAIARMGAQAAAALQAAHEFGIIHRDIKPSNLLIDEQGKLWITDFGLARFRKNSNLTQTGDVLGTMRYMSPEQALGRATLIDHRTDIYSLGLTLYELAALRHPAEGVRDAQVPFERARTSYKPLRHWNRQIPVDFQTIIMKAIGEFPHERYATARELESDLRRFLEGRPILASPPSVWTRVSKWTKRHRGAVVAAAAVLVLGFFANYFLATRDKAAFQRALVDSQKNLRQTNAVLDRFSSQLVDQLAAVPGAEGVRHQLLEDSLGLYRQFLDRAAGDPALASELAAAYSKIGNLTEKMGDRATALQKHQAALNIWQERVSQNPTNKDYVCNLAACQNSIGLMLAELGREHEALKSLEQAELLLQKTVVTSPESTELQTQIAATYSNLGFVLRQLSARDDAIAKFRAAIEIQEPLAAASPADEALTRGLAASYNNLGSLTEAIDFTVAAQAYQKAISLQRGLVKADPVNRIYQAELARTYNNLGYSHAQRQEWQTAEMCYADAIGLQANLVQASPLVAAYRRDLAISHNNLGMVQSQSCRPAEAEASFREAIRLQKLLLTAQPADLTTLSNLGGVYNNLAMLLDEQSQPEDSEQAFRDAIRLQKQAVEMAPGVNQFRDLLNKHYVNYARYLRKHNQPQAATQVTLERAKAQELAIAGRGTD